METGKSLVVSLIGRPNVGKSTLFNRLMRKSTKTITHDKPGVTRDRHYGLTKLDEIADESPVELILVDTGGFYPERTDVNYEKAQKEGSYKDQEKAKFDTFFNIMTDHAKTAIEESDIVLLVVDVREGLLPFDEGISNLIREKKKNFILVANKFDSDKQIGEEAEFYALGVDYEDMFTVSSAHGIGIDPLRKRLQEESLKGQKRTKHLQRGVTPQHDVVGRVAIVGAPNAGKSTLLNYLVGAQRALVSDIAGTTVDPIEGFFDLNFKNRIEYLTTDDFSVNDQMLIKEYEKFRDVDTFDETEEDLEELDFEEFNLDMDSPLLESDDAKVEELVEKLFESDDEEGDETEASQEIENTEIEEIEEEVNTWRTIHVIDTAGIRKQTSVEGFIETQSVYRALRSITESDVVLHMVDATKGIGHQDRRLIDIALEKGKSVIILLNKMDLMKAKFKTQKERKDWLIDLRAKIPWLYYCDIIPVSAKRHKGMQQVKEALLRTLVVRHRKIPTGELNRVFVELADKNPVILKGARGKHFKIKYASMVKSSPPTFLLFTNKSMGIPDNYKRYLQNGVRYAFRLDNSPIHLIFRTSYDLEQRRKKMHKEK